MTISCLNAAYLARALLFIISASSNPQNIQDSECSTVDNSADCGVIKKCNWDFLSNECHWRCNFLTDKSSCSTKGAAPTSPKKRTRGCYWFDKPSPVTGNRCDYDCEQRTPNGLSDCIQSPSCMWTGKACKVGCQNYVQSECAIVKEEGYCVWERKASGSESCKQDCGPRPDRDTCDPAGQRSTCEWDDCKRRCRDTTKVQLPDATWKRKFQLESDCFERGVNSRWYWDYQCTGKHSHCFIEDYKTKNAIFKSGNKCDYATFDLKDCVADCEALNKLALDSTYKDAEPKFDTSLAKAQHFCEQEKATCTWSNGKCGWKKSCDVKWPSQIMTTKPAAEQTKMVSFMRFDMCDAQTCTAARSGGGSSAIDLHGQCQDVKVVTGVGRLRKQRCFEKCELRSTQADCTSQGQGGRLADTYKGKACGPMKLAADGSLDETSGTLQLPQECVGMCRWVSGKCLTACEFRATQSECAGTCKWDNNAATGVKEYGGLPDLIPCTGEPSTPLFAASTVAQGAATKVAGFTEKGGAGFVGPVSTCILAAHLAGTTSHNCYSSVTLSLDTRYESVYVAPSPSAPTPAPSSCVQDPAKKVSKTTLRIEAKKTDGDALASEKNAFAATNTTFKDTLREGFAKTMTLFCDSQKYTFTKDMITLTDIKVTGSYLITADFLVTLPAGHRPSALVDRIVGNANRKIVGFLEVSSSEASDFGDFFKQHTFTSKWKTAAFGDDEWKWEFTPSIASLEKFGTTPAKTPKPSPSPGPGPKPEPEPEPEPEPSPPPANPAPAPASESNVEIKADLTLTVPNPDEFVKDTVAQTAVREGIASSHAVAVSAIKLDVSKVRRLALVDSERRLAGSVKISYTITVPASSTTTDALKKKAQTVTAAELTSAIQTKVTAKKGSGYSISVTSKSTPVVAVVPKTVSPGTGTGSASTATSLCDRRNIGAMVLLLFAALSC